MLMITITIMMTIKFEKSRKYAIIIPILMINLKIPFFSCLSTLKFFSSIVPSEGIVKIDAITITKFISQIFEMILSEIFWKGSWKTVIKFAQSCTPQYQYHWIAGFFAKITAKPIANLLIIK